MLETDSLFIMDKYYYGYQNQGFKRKITILGDTMKHWSRAWK